MLKQQYIPFLENFLAKLKIALEPSQTQSLLKITESRMLSRGEFFIKAGEVPVQIGLVVKGLFRFFYIDPQGNDYTKHFATEGATIFSYTAQITGKASQFYIEALEDSEILVINCAALEILAQDNYLYLLMIKKLVDQALILKENRESSFLLETNLERYCHFLQKYPHLEPRVKQYHLASYLGMTPVSLSRVRKKVKIIK